jgi:hypothetical protein
MSVSYKKLLAGLVLLAVACLYITILVGCHSAPERPKENPQMSAQRKAKRDN